MGATLLSEWGKTWSVRSPRLCLAGTVLVVVFIAVTLGNDFVHAIGIGEVAPDATKPIVDVVGPASFFGFAVFAAFAMLPLTTEYTTGSIRSTFQAQPRRQVVLASKAVIGVGAGLLIGALAGWLAVVGGAFALGDHAAVLAGAHVTIPVKVAALLAVDAVLVFGLAATIRSAVGTLAAAVMVLAGTLALPERASVWTPGGAAAEFLSGSTAHYPPAAGLLVVAVWAVVTYTAGAWLLQRRDA
jgi:ABC-2 type transport system permease protein